MKKRINNLELLLAEKKELQLRCKEKEQLINQHVHYIQNNIGTILFQSFSPFKKNQTNAASGVLDVVNDFIVGVLPVNLDKDKTGKILKVVQMAAAGFLYKKVKSFFDKKQKPA